MTVLGGVAVSYERGGPVSIFLVQELEENQKACDEHLEVISTPPCEDRVLNGPASGEERSKGMN